MYNRENHSLLLVLNKIEPPTKEQLFRTTYWTRNQKLNDDHLVMNEKINNENSIPR